MADREQGDFGSGKKTVHHHQENDQQNAKRRIGHFPAIILAKVDNQRRSRSSEQVTN
jgi:hypothetical protein